MKERLRNSLRNKYVLTPIVFLVWMAFFNDVDLFFLWKSKREAKVMREEIVYLEHEIEQTRESLHDISTNSETLEKFARETYFMKKPNEDIFIVRITE
ncbi:MAG: septum formation initiator family protein [Flavobacteriales bacterium]|jgi:cell division protein FtsB